MVRFKNVEPSTVFAYLTLSNSARALLQPATAIRGGRRREDVHAGRMLQYETTKHEMTSCTDGPIQGGTGQLITRLTNDEIDIAMYA